jgi:hypothetical protein
MNIMFPRLPPSLTHHVIYPVVIYSSVPPEDFECARTLITLAASKEKMTNPQRRRQLHRSKAVQFQVRLCCFWFLRRLDPDALSRWIGDFEVYQHEVTWKCAQADHRGQWTMYFYWRKRLKQVHRLKDRLEHLLRYHPSVTRRGRMNWMREVRKEV